MPVAMASSCSYSIHQDSWETHPHDLKYNVQEAMESFAFPDKNEMDLKKLNWTKMLSSKF